MSLSPNVCPLCGTQALSWKDIPFCITIIRDQGSISRHLENIRTSLSITTLFDLHSIKSEWYSRALGMVHRDFGHLSCSVAHDSIVALLGLFSTSNEQAHEFKVDYTLSIPELSIQVLRRYQYSHPLALLTRVMASSRSPASKIAEWQSDGRVIFPRLEPAHKDLTESFRKYRFVERYSPTPGLCMYERVSDTRGTWGLNVCCYLVPNEPQPLEDQLYPLGARESLIVRHQQFKSPKVVGVALGYINWSSRYWRVDLISPYLHHAESFMKTSLLSYGRPWFTGQDRELVIEVDFQHYKSHAWLSGALFGHDPSNDAGPKSYWEQSSKAMLKLFRCKSGQATWESELAALMR